MAFLLLIGSVSDGLNILLLHFIDWGDSWFLLLNISLILGVVLFPLVVLDSAIFLDMLFSISLIGIYIQILLVFTVYYYSNVHTDY